MKNRKLLLIVSIVLALTMSLGGTLAYLTDTDADVNTMVLGNVKITQNEQQRVEVNGEFTSQLEEFEQYKMMLPVTYPGNRTEDSVTVGEYTVPLSDKEANYIDKIVSVTNDGNTDAYVRTLVAVPTGGDAWELTAVSANDCWLHWNYPNTQDWSTSWTLNSTYTFAEINEKGYYVWEFVHKTAVEAGKTTYPVVKGFYLDQRVDTNDEGYYYVKYADNSTRVVTDFKPGETVDILVLSQAVQAGGFADVQTALDTGFGDVTKDNAEAWFGGLEVPTSVSTAAELKDALAKGGNIVVNGEIEITEMMTVPAGVAAKLTVQGEIAGKSTATGKNFDMIQVNGELTITGSGAITMKHEGDNMGWDNCTSIVRVGGNGKLVVDNTTLANLGGTDMAYAIDCSNAGTNTGVQIQINNSIVEATYTAVRLFNNALNGKIDFVAKDSKLHGDYRAFWIHFWTTEDGVTDERRANTTYTIYDNGNTITNGTASNPKNNPIRLGYANATYYDAQGNDVTIR